MFPFGGRLTEQAGPAECRYAPVRSRHADEGRGSDQAVGGRWVDTQADQRLARTLRASDQAGTGHRGRQAERHLEAEDRSKHPEAGRVEEGTVMTGYVVVFEGDDQSGYSAYSPDLPGVVAAADTREETEALMREAMSEHIAILRQTGQPVPEAAAAAVTIVGIPAA